MLSLPRLPFELPGFSLPIAVPGRIQQRFVSFLLQRFLGHLVKPGQLDASQIDAQIGGGTVEIKRIELDEQAINASLKGLPFTLHHGFIGNVAAKIPWQNVLTAPVTLAVDGLDITLKVSPRCSTEYDVTASHLAESVVSVAQDFLNEGLSPNENEELRESIVLAKDLPEEDITASFVPGGLDPFSDDPPAQPLDPIEGVSVLATVMERLLSRLSFTVDNFTLRIIHEGRSELILRIKHIEYGTEDVDPSEATGDEVRTIRTVCVTTSMRDLRAQLPSLGGSKTASRSTTPPPSDDEEMDASMTQSVLSLPESSMYMSATSSIRTASPEPLPPPSQSPQLPQSTPEQTILSLGDDPIILRLRTPKTSDSSLNAERRDIGLSVELGTLAVALRSQHIKALLELAECLSSPSSPTAQSRQAPAQAKSFFDNACGSIKMKGAVVAALLASPTEHTISSFFAKPRSPMQTHHIRLFIDEISGSVSTANPSHILDASINDISAFYIHVPSSTIASLVASPLVIFDRHLTTQYDAAVMKLRLLEFNVKDWTGGRASNKPKRSLWRVEPSVRRTPAEDRGVAVAFRKAVDGSSTAPIHIITQPVHIFVDTSFVSCLLPFLQALTPEPSDPRRQSQIYDEDNDGDEAQSSPFEPVLGIKNQAGEADIGDTPRPATVELPGMEGEMLERMVLRDIDEEPTTKPTGPNQLELRCPMLRVEVRTESPPDYPQRSGAVVLDLHEIEVEIRDSPLNPTPPRRARFPGLSGKTLKEVAAMSWRWGLIAHTGPTGSKARGIISIGALHQEDDEGPSALIPRIYLRSSESTTSGQQTTTVEALIPFVGVDIGKSALDSLQLWADDVTQWMERALGDDRMPTDSRAASIIGSRYFEHRTASVVESEASGRPEQRSEFAIKLVVSEASVSLNVPRKDSTTPRPLRFRASDLEALIEVKPEGKEETVITVGLTDLLVEDVQRDTSVFKLLSLTSPRSLMTPTMPLLKLRFVSITLKDANAKQSRVKITLFGFTYTFHPDLAWVSDLSEFAKAPPGTFEQVVPNERTKVSLSIIDGSILILAPNHPGGMLIGLSELNFETDIVSEIKALEFHLTAPGLAVLILDDRSNPADGPVEKPPQGMLSHWARLGYAVILRVKDLDLLFNQNNGIQPAETVVEVHNTAIQVLLCADSIPTLAAFGGDLALAFQDLEQESEPTSHGVTRIEPTERRRARDLTMTLDENAFRRLAPALSHDPDMVEDDLPTNPDYIDASYGSAAGVRDLTDEDLDEFDDGDLGGRRTPTQGDRGVVSITGGETIKMLTPDGLNIIEGYYDNLPLNTDNLASDLGVTAFSLRVIECSANIHLYSGYDWHRTRKTIEDETKAMRKRLEKIRQLLATGQTPDDSIEQTSAVLFNSVHLGLSSDADEWDTGALIAAIDQELDDELETATQSSWQSFAPRTEAPQPKPKVKSKRPKKLSRANKASVEICLGGLRTEIDNFRDDEPLASRVFATVRDLEILDHMKTSTWKKFLTSMKSDSRGNVRETDSSMIRFELRNVKPVAGLRDEEARLRLKVLPLKLHVDQDALDFLKAFFSFQDVNAFIQPNPPPPKPDIYFQHIEVFPVEIKLDYKPKRVDYKALKEGRTIELMNFFHFEGAEMTLRHITLTGLTGWAKLGDTLNDMWTPDVKANQLADVISGVSPVRSLVNVGTGVADLVLLPIAQYRKDKRLVRGVQKGAGAFVKSTAMEAIKLGARLATGTQVILEQAEGVLGAQDVQFDHIITAETLPSPILRPRPLGPEDERFNEDYDGRSIDRISKYADQPDSVKEGMQTAYRSLTRNLNSAAQTILAVPMEVYERSGTEGPVRAVVRAVPIAVLRPMIGASEALSKTLWGLRNTLDPEIKHENEDKYKR